MHEVWYCRLRYVYCKTVHANDWQGLRSDSFLCLLPAITFVVTLVESNDKPNGLELVSSYQTNRLGDPMDLVSLAQVVQKVNAALASLSRLYCSKPLPHHLSCFFVFLVR